MKAFITSVLLLIVTLGYGQFNLNFYQMQGATPQNMNYNPAIFPKAKVFVCLPGLSGVDLSVNNSFGVLDLFTPTGDSSLVDINRFLSNRKKKAYLNTSMSITDLMVGFRMGENGFGSFFVNERLDATGFYPNGLLDFLWEGNGAYLGQDYTIDDISFDATWYREIGIGYGRSFNILGFNVDLGARLKLLNGIIHSSIKKNLEMSIYTSEEDYAMTVTIQNGLSRGAGFDALDEEDYGYLGFNSNIGFGIDLGGQLELTDRITVGLSAVDLGFINWSEYSETGSFDGTSFDISGTTFDDIDQLGEAVIDSLEALDVDTVANSFTTSLNSKIFLNGSYRLTENGYATAILSNYFTQGKMKSAFGIGYTQELGKWLAASATFSAASQYGADMGLGLMLRGGFFQTFISVDHIFGTINVPEATGANVKFGFNLLFGGGPEKKENLPDKL